MPCYNKIKRSHTLRVSDITRYIQSIDAHRGGGEGGEGGGKIQYPPQANFKTLVNKNAIKPEKGGPHQANFPESLDPPRDFGKKHQVPPPLDFQPMCIYDSKYAGNAN